MIRRGMGRGKMSAGTHYLLLVVVTCWIPMASSRSCSLGEYLKGGNACEPCIKGYYMDEESHQRTQCFQCDRASGIGKIVKRHCTRCANAEIVCDSGYYRRQKRGNRFHCNPCTNCTKLGKVELKACRENNNTVCLDDKTIVLYCSMYCRDACRGLTQPLTHTGHFQSTGFSTSTMSVICSERSTDYNSSTSSRLETHHVIILCVFCVLVGFVGAKLWNKLRQTTPRNRSGTIETSELRSSLIGTDISEECVTSNRHETLTRRNSSSPTRIEN